MATVSVAANQAASDVVLTANSLFDVVEGSLVYSTDAGTTYMSFPRGRSIIISIGLTVKVKNQENRPAVFQYMPV